MSWGNVYKGETMTTLLFVNRDGDEGAFSFYSLITDEVGVYLQNHKKIKPYMLPEFIAYDIEHEYVHKACHKELRYYPLSETLVGMYEKLVDLTIGRYVSEPSGVFVFKSPEQYESELLTKCRGEK